MDQEKTKFLNINSLFKKSNLIYIEGIIIAVVIIIIFIAITEKKQEKAPFSNIPKTEIVTISKSENKEELPADFPEIPLNGKKEITDNYALNYISSKSSQKVIDFTSSKSLKENINFYKNWAGKNGWQVAYEINNESESRLIMKKDKKPLVIVIAKNNNESKINISW